MKRYFFLLSAAALLASCGAPSVHTSSTGGTSSAPTSSASSTHSGSSQSSTGKSSESYIDPCSISGSSTSTASSKTYEKGDWTADELALFGSKMDSAYANAAFGFAATHSSEFDTEYGCITFTIPNAPASYATSYANYLLGKNYIVSEEDAGTAAVAVAYSAYFEYEAGSVKGTVCASIYASSYATYVDFYPHARSSADMTEWEDECKALFNTGFYEGAYAKYPTYQKEDMTCYTGYLETYGVLRFMDNKVDLADIEALYQAIEGLGYIYSKTTDEDGNEWYYWSLVTTYGECGIQISLSVSLKLYYDCYFWAN